jgi:hypothetical protein
LFNEDGFYNGMFSPWAIMEYKKSKTNFLVMYIGVKMDILLVCKGNTRREGEGAGGRGTL